MKEEEECQWVRLVYIWNNPHRYKSNGFGSVVGCKGAVSKNLLIPSPPHMARSGATRIVSDSRNGLQNRRLTCFDHVDDFYLIFWTFAEVKLNTLEV